MAALFLTRRTVSVLQQKGFFTVIRGFSALVPSNAPSTSASERSCTIIGKYQDIVLSDEKFELLDTYVAKSPPVSVIPSARLITVDPSKTLECSDDCRHLLWTGFLQSSFAKDRGLSLSGVFDQSNVGVITDMGILAFRSLVPNVASNQSFAGHQAYGIFAEEFLSKLHGAGTLQKLPEWETFIKSLSLSDEVLLTYNSVFFQSDAVANLFCDVHRLLRHQFVCRGLGTEAAKILLDVDKIYSDVFVTRKCSVDPFLKHLVGGHSPVARARRILGLSASQLVKYPPGSAAVDVHRHSVTHAIEVAVRDNLLTQLPQADHGLVNSYRREEIVNLLRYVFCRYPQAVLDSFWKHKMWDHLDMSRRLKTPSIFLYTSPVDSPPAEQSSNSS